MFQALKNLGRKTLSLLLLIILVPILLIVIIAILQSCGRKMSYDKYETKMLAAAKKYFRDNDMIPDDTNVSSVVTLDTLVNEKYLKSPEKLLNDTCTGSVSVRRNGSNKYGESNLALNYLTNLVCSNYNSKSLLSGVMSNLTNTDSGLYETSNGYIFKGNRPNNYLMFYGNLYRIVSVDKAGIVKLIKENSEPITRVWDNKYNIDADRSLGINTYKDSSIVYGLLEDYNTKKKINLIARGHIVSYDACIGKRSSANVEISRDLDCSEILTNQVISLPNLSDFALASLDPNCTTITSKSCRNYNYLTNVLSDTWTLNASSDNTYEVFYLNSGLAYLDNANEHHVYNIVIYIDGSEKVKSGVGTKDDPFVIE